MKNLFKTMFRISLKSNNFMRSNFLIICKNWRRKLYLLLIIIVASFLDLKHENYFWLLEKEKNCNLTRCWVFVYQHFMSTETLYHKVGRRPVLWYIHQSAFIIFFVEEKVYFPYNYIILWELDINNSAFWTLSNTRDFIRIRWNLAKFSYA